MAKPETPRKPAKKAVKAKTAPSVGETSSPQENPPEAPKKKIGRPSKYTPEIAQESQSRYYQPKTERVYTEGNNRFTGEEYGQARNPAQTRQKGRQGQNSPQCG